jgi:hypothetical protein
MHTGIALTTNGLVALGATETDSIDSTFAVKVAARSSEVRSKFVSVAVTNLLVELGVPTVPINAAC